MSAASAGMVGAHPVWKEQDMTSAPTRHDTDRTTAEREAWDAYRDSLRDLEGAAYEEVEHAAWERLQETLLDLRASEPDD